MALLDDLVAQVGEPALRRRIEVALADLKRKQRFGLVFEEHIPETTTLPGQPIQEGALVQRRDDPSGNSLYRVTSMNGRGQVSAEPVNGAESVKLARKDLLVVKRFGDPIYPALAPVGVTRRGPKDKPHHAVIGGENFHALQLFLYLYEGQADCIYLDPPYNTGARDWKYNNRYVDKNDSWRHSKWLSMMEKRLRLARRLLKSDGVLIVTIDENEAHHLGMLLEKIFPDYLRYMITIIINPKGREKANFAPVEEYAFFIVPDIGEDVITRAPAGAPEQQELFEAADDDAEDDEEIEEEEDDDGQRAEDEEEINSEPEWEWRHARRRGGGAERSSYRDRRPNQFYPIYIDEKARTVVRVGKSIPVDKEPSFKKVDGLRPIWPIDGAGDHRCWAFVPDSMQDKIDAGDVALGKYNAKRDSWTIKYRVPKKSTRKLKTVWQETAYDAGTHGTELLKKFLGRPGLFPFPKSVYAVEDCLAAVVRNRPNALIIDVFAGSGTTLHATCLLNAKDEGSRRCILVTNNEVSEKEAKRLNKEGYYRGDPEFEKHGIFEQVTRPRCEAVVTGRRADGSQVPGRHINGRPLSQGFPENVDFYRIEYLDPDEVDLGRQFDAIHPALWLAAGGVGERGAPSKAKGYLLPKGSTYGVLFKESEFRDFVDALEERPEVTHVWLVTDSEEAYAEMCAALPSRVVTSMLYRDYLRNFRINTERTL